MMNNYAAIEFEMPWALLLLLLLPWLLWRHFWRVKNDEKTIDMPSVEPITQVGIDWIGKFKPVLFGLRWLSIFCIIIAIARPRINNEWQTIDHTQGVDIILVADISRSMLENDLYPTRLAALQKVAIDFVEKRSSDRIGLVAYSREAFMKMPLTVDRKLIIETIKNLMVDEYFPGTSIGNGLGVAINHMKDSKAKSRVLILMTDGVNNGKLDPLVVTQIAKDYKIKVYTIGIGRKSSFFGGGTEFDEKLLKTIAQQTNGVYFKAENNKSLAKVYEEIDALEKSDVKEEKYNLYEELFRKFLLSAFIFLGVESLFRITIYRSFI